uniref:Protein kinase domain-containing protein n=1 Tax=Pseudonaja textilis TaxID=8673 RepID=A0A670Y149_PSETE
MYLYFILETLFGRNSNKLSHTSQKYAMKEIKYPKSVFNIEKTWNESIILNVFLTQNGKIKLEDFGSAVLLKYPMVYNMPHSNRSDIWSLESVLYELSTLKHQFQAMIWKHLTLKIYKGYYNPLSSDYIVNPKYCPSASTILARKCLAKCNGQSSLPKENGTYAGSKNEINKGTKPKVQRKKEEKIYRSNYKYKITSCSTVTT